MDRGELRRVLERADAYPCFEVAFAAGELQRILPTRLSGHIKVVYRRLEWIAEPAGPALAALRLAILVHEEPPESLPAILAAAGLSDLGPTVLGVVSGFGALWKITRDHDIADYVAAHKAHLAALLLFELAHEGQPTPGMERAAELGHLRGSFDVWANRLSSETRR